MPTNVHHTVTCSSSDGSPPSATPTASASMCQKFMSPTTKPVTTAVQAPSATQKRQPGCVAATVGPRPPGMAVVLAVDSGPDADTIR